MRLLPWRLCVFLACSILTTAGTARGAFQRYTTLEGLPSNTVGSIVEDSTGNLWFGTASGVGRFDGIAWRNYGQADGLVDPVLGPAFVDSRNRVWFSFGGSGGCVLPTRRGVALFNGTSWQIPDSLANEHVTAIAEDATGSLWFGTLGRGLRRFDGESWSTYASIPGPSSGWILSLLPDRRGGLWVGTDVSTDRRDANGSWEYGVGDLAVSAMHEESDGTLWFGSEAGVVERRTDSGSEMFPLTTGTDPVRHIVQDPSGTVWISTFSNLHRYDRGVGLHPVDGFANLAWKGMSLDHSGNLWLGVCNGGVARYDRVAWDLVLTEPTLGLRDIRAFARDAYGGSWYGGYGGVVRERSGILQTFTSALPETVVMAILPAPDGSMWIGTKESGLVKLTAPDSTWSSVQAQTYTVGSGLTDARVTALFLDRSQGLWVGTANGIDRFDGSTWTHFGVESGVPEGEVIAMLEMPNGDVWVGASFGGTARFRDGAWLRFGEAQGLPDPRVTDLAMGPDGTLWASTFSGLSRFEGSGWVPGNLAPGAPQGGIGSMLVDQKGGLWCAGPDLSHFDGEVWHSLQVPNAAGPDYDPPTELGPAFAVSLLAEDVSGRIWLPARLPGNVAWADPSRLIGLDPDRVPPRVLLLTEPPRVSTGPSVSATIAAGFDEVIGTLYSTRLDSSPWSPWTRVNSWTATGLPDGAHILGVRIRDGFGNRDSQFVAFEIDGQPPIPVLTSPVFGQTLRNGVVVRGTATDDRFVSYRVEQRRATGGPWSLIALSSVPVASGELASWHGAVPDGSYELRLSVTDSLGLIGTTQVTVVVDNQFPFVEETAPATVRTESGGDLYTEDQRVHLYVPPHGFSQDAVVLISASTAPDTVAEGVVRSGTAYEITWNPAALEKPATLSWALDHDAVVGSPSIYVQRPGEAWVRLGGTVEGSRVALNIRDPGRYALYHDATLVLGEPGLSELSFTPRIFSVTGRYADERIAIGFTLGQAAPVTVRVYSRSGRLVREVATAEVMGPGASLVRWDGRDRAGVHVPDGIYVVTVESAGTTRRNTIAVVR